MAQMTRDGRKVIDQLIADLKDIAAAADLDRKAVVFDPVGAADALSEIRDTTETMRRRIYDDLTPLLERAERNREAATLPERVAELERRLEALEAQSKVTSFLRREA